MLSLVKSEAAVANGPLWPPDLLVSQLQVEGRAWPRHNSEEVLMRLAAHPELLHRYLNSQPMELIPSSGARAAAVTWLAHRIAIGHAAENRQQTCRQVLAPGQEPENRSSLFPEEFDMLAGEEVLSIEVCDLAMPPPQSECGSVGKAWTITGFMAAFAIAGAATILAYWLRLI